ncbi:cellulose synthase/poly-beta-1,6-N-acetylglucosamine synthase-like glycosyltransferase [Desulfitispora alkaliphila]|uniref:glycosyltransferase family 2 protein n=1 Tax=Desulfitispora alkaliphila TaxID=622674 RepID=UPI003D1B8351
MEQLAIQLLIIFSLIVILFSAFLFFRRLYISEQHRKKSQRQKVIAQIYQNYVDGIISEGELIDALEESEIYNKEMIILEVLLEYANICSTLPSNAALEKLGIINLLKTMLSSRAGWKKATALNALIKFNITGFAEEAEKLLAHKEELISYTAAEYLITIKELEKLDRIIKILSQTDDWYLHHYAQIFAQYQEEAFHILMAHYNSTVLLSEKLCIVKMLRGFTIPQNDSFLKELVFTEDKIIRETIAEYLIEKDPGYLVQNNFSNDISPYVRSLYFRGFMELGYDDSNLQVLLTHSLDKSEVIRRSIVAALTHYCQTNPKTIEFLEENLVRFHEYDKAIIHVFDQLNITDDYIRNLIRPEGEQKARTILKKYLELGELGDILRFLSTSRNDSINKKLTELVCEYANSQDLENNSDLLERTQEPYKSKIKEIIRPNLIRQAEKTEDKNIKQRLILLSVLITVIIAPFIIFGYKNLNLLLQHNISLFITYLILDFNKAIIFYVASINTIYLILNFLSYAGLKRYSEKKKAWQLGDYFKRKLIPPISIIAPCYNESATVIESINSLLNIRYPRFQVVVVNDGSKDDTLAKLIGYYELEKTNYIYREMIPTSKIRNTYSSVRFDNLVVVDKENGGKADALNAGINIAEHPIFCAIDADTLIEGDSLINASAPFSFDHLKTAATGGNIRVINNCRIDNGVIEKFNIPRGTVENFQVIEYIRAFTGGRIGWSYLNSLLIISGAFGLFKKRMAFNIGGYSTKESRNLDTVGEDMELVVSYHKYLAKRKEKYQITFCHDANGWTEVPNDLKSLKKQRNRWQRGLIEVLTSNFSLFFNPRYGRVGTTAYPYFFIFEFIGPWIEVMGYVFVVLALFMGILNPSIFILLFVFSVLFGIIISLFGLYIDEKESIRYSNKEFFKLLGFAFIENLGFRQMGAFWRAGAFISLLLNRQGWGTITRRGFAPNISQGQ